MLRLLQINLSCHKIPLINDVPMLEETAYISLRIKTFGNCTCRVTANSVSLPISSLNWFASLYTKKRGKKSRRKKLNTEHTKRLVNWCKFNLVVHVPGQLIYKCTRIRWVLNHLTRALALITSSLKTKGFLSNWTKFSLLVKKEKEYIFRFSTYYKPCNSKSEKKRLPSRQALTTCLLHLH